MSGEERALKACLGQQKDGELLYTLSHQLGLTPISHDWEQTNTQYRWRVALEEVFRAIETARHAARLALALEAWKLQHGSLPKSLDQLVGPCLDKLPVDPYSGEPFRYFRNGLGIPLGWKQPLYGWDASTTMGKIPANVPFLWSTGAKVFWNPNTKEENDIRRGCFIYADWATSSDVYRSDQRFQAHALRIPNSAYDIWESGWPFQIP
jgi:hypothetical protein